MVLTLHSATRWPGNGLLAHWSQLPAVSRILSHWKVRPPLSPVRLLHPVKVQGPQQRLVCPLNAPKSSGSTSSPIFYVNLYILYVYVYILCIFHVTEPRNRSTTLAASSYCFWEVRPSIRPATLCVFCKDLLKKDKELGGKCKPEQLAMRGSIVRVKQKFLYTFTLKADASSAMQVLWTHEIFLKLSFKL